MDDRVDRVLIDGRRHEFDVADVADHERQRPDCRPVPGAQVVDDHDAVTGVGQMLCGQRADVAGTARDQDAHGAGPTATVRWSVGGCAVSACGGSGLGQAAPDRRRSSAPTPSGTTDPARSGTSAPVRCRRRAVGRSRGQAAGRAAAASLAPAGPGRAPTTAAPAGPPARAAPDHRCVVDPGGCRACARRGRSRRSRHRPGGGSRRRTRRRRGGPGHGRRRGSRCRRPAPRPGLQRTGAGHPRSR